MAININNLANEITKELKRYTSDVKVEVEVAQNEIAKDAVKELKSTSPKLTGSYAKGWSTKKVGNAQVIHNRTDGNLTHLLEKGHAKRNGGRVQAYPHIAPVEEKVIDEYIERVEKAVQS